MEALQNMTLGGLNPLEWCGLLFFVGGLALVFHRFGRGARGTDASPEVDTVARPQAIERSGGEETVLVVDDDPTVLRSHAKLIASLGYKVDQALGGKAAIENVREKKPDLIVLDLLMPEQDGVQTLEAIREIRPEQRTIVLSGYAGPSMVSSIRALGVHTYLIKPTERSMLGKAIRDELDRAA